MVCQSMLMHTPSAKRIPDIKGSRQEGEIRNTRNYRLLFSFGVAPGAYCVCAHAEDTVPSCWSKENVLVAMARKGQGAVY